MFLLKLQLFAALWFGFNVLAAEPLPRVLILGDSFYQNLAVNSAAQEFTGRAQVVYANPGDTSHALAHIDELLGKDKWDVICFNFGLSDLSYRHPGLKGIRALSKAAGGVRVSSPDLFQKNLAELVRRFQATGAKLIWCSTTPPPAINRTNYDVDSEIEYNAIAAKIMSLQNVRVSDLHAYAVACANEKKPPQFKEPFLQAITAALEPDKGH